MVKELAVALTLVAGGVAISQVSKSANIAPVAKGGADVKVASGPASQTPPAKMTGTNAAKAVRLASLGSSQPKSIALLNKAPQVYRMPFVAKSGDTLARILKRAGVAPVEAHNAIRALEGVLDPRSLKIGQTIKVAYRPATTQRERARFNGFEIPLDYATQIAVSPTPDGGYRAQNIKRNLQTRLVRATGTISWSLLAAGQKAGVPPSVMAKLVRAFSWDVDFQRDIRKNDRFEILYKQRIDKTGRAVHNGRIFFAALTLSGQRKAIYLHKFADGTFDYFDAQGRSVKKALMRTPINGARLSSPFGKRMHPILGYTKMHKGVDFAASAGTPIYAAGDGVVNWAGRRGAYGIYVRIRHNSEFSTAYAHMRAIKRGITRGVRVRQGQIIGYVGATGRATGPHLHYEILRRGTQVNPMRVKMPSGKTLKGLELARFKSERAQIQSQWASLKNQQPQLAQR